MEPIARVGGELSDVSCDRQRALRDLNEASYLEPVDGVARQTTTTTRTTTTTTTTRGNIHLDTGAGRFVDREPPEVVLESAIVEDLGRQAISVDSSNRLNFLQATRQQKFNKQTESKQEQRTNIATSSKSDNGTVDSNWKPVSVDGHKLVTTIGTIAAKSSESQIVVAILKDGGDGGNNSDAIVGAIQLKIQEMKPGIFEVGGSRKECEKFLLEHQKIMTNLQKQRQAPLECWLGKYQRIQANEPNMSKEMKLVYMCMAENLQGCWKALLGQLEQRLLLLDETCKFYQSTEQLNKALEQAENHVQSFRQEFLDGPSSVAGSLRFNQAFNELKRLNQLILIEWSKARHRQQQLVQLVGQLATGNLGDSRANQLILDGQNLINYLQAYLQPLERRKIQLENVITTTSRTTANNLIERQTRSKFLQENSSLNEQPPMDGSSGANKQQQLTSSNNIGQNSWQRQQSKRFSTTATTTTTTNNYIRGITSFNDLNLVDNWLNIKIDQLNSSLLSSLGVGVQDSRSILSKHEQIAIECSAIEEATLNFNGKNIHALKQVDPKDDKMSLSSKKSSLFEQQKLLANKTRDVITILDARIVLLRRTIDFYSRAKEATGDIGKMMRRLQVDNSLQSVQFVSTELELKDVSSVVASGATILSELQQLQLAQKHGQRSSIVNLNLITNGIRTIIDQLNQDLAHLKTVLNQRRLVLLNEDANKMANNFSSKCQQLHQWLNGQAKSYLMANNRIELGRNQAPVRASFNGHEQLRLSIQNKTLEVEALLRLLSTLLESLDAKSELADEIQRDTDSLRQDWIQVTNCLDRRLELIKKYLLILQTIETIDKDLDSLDPKSQASGGGGGGGRPRTPDERSEEDVQSAIKQALVQLTNQVKNFALDAKRLNTALVLQTSDRPPGAPSDSAALQNRVVDDLNKDQLIEQANELMNQLTERQAILLNPSRARDGQRQVSGKIARANNRVTSTKTDNENVSPTVGISNTNNTKSQLQAREPRQPLFTKLLPICKDVEPFSTVELDCELDPQVAEWCQVDWLMNNNKRIPSNIKHSIGQIGNKFNLIIRQFNPICCATYTARAGHKLTGQTASTSCRLRLSGIKEHGDDGEEASADLDADQPVQLVVEDRRFRAGSNGKFSSNNNTNFNGATQSVARTSGGKTTAAASSFSQWHSISNNDKGLPTSSGWRGNNNITKTTSKTITTESRVMETTTTPNSKELALERIVQGVEGASDTEREHTNGSTIYLGPQVPIIQATYNGRPRATPLTATNNPSASNQLRINYIDSPSSYSSSVNLNNTSRSVSRSPFDGTPVAPSFTQDLTVIGVSPTAAQAADADTAPCCSGSGHLVCVVVGNPPPTIEWLHNDKLIATAKCSKQQPKQQHFAPQGNQKRANVCKLTIETINNRTRGEYVCRATNRLGQTTSNVLMLTK